MVQVGRDGSLRLGFDVGSRVISVIVPIAIAAISAGSIAPWAPPQQRGDWRDAVFSALMMAVCVSALWGPRVIADSRGVTIVNVFWSYWAPWSAVESIGETAFLEVSTRDGKAVRAWAVQATGATGARARARVEGAAAVLRDISADGEVGGKQLGWSKHRCWPNGHQALALSAVLGLGLWVVLV